MAIKKTDFALGVKPVPVTQAADVVSIRVAYTVPTGGLAIGDVVELMPLPEDHVPVECAIDYDALGASSTATVGVVNAAGTGIDTAAQSGGAAWISAQATSAAGLTRDSTSACRRTQPISNNVNGPGSRRMLGWLVGGGAVTAGTVIGFTLNYRAANYGA